MSRTRQADQRTRRPILALAAAALLAASAGMSFERVLGPAALAPAVAIGALGPAVLTAVWSAGRRRLPLWAAIAASLACWLLAACATLLRSTEIAGVLPTAATGRAVGAAVSDSWWQMLTTILPVQATPRLLLAVQLLVWLASLAAAEAVARGSATISAALPAAVVLTAGLALGVDGQGSAEAPAVATMASAGLLLVARQAQDAGTRRWRLLATGTPVLTVVCALAALLGPRLPFATARAPFDPRSYVHPAVQVQTPASPLDYVSSWLAQPARPLFRVRTTAPQNWRLAVLDHFDGITWTEPGRLEDTGGRVPGDPATDAPRGDVTQTYTIELLGGSWLPEADRPVVITGLPADADPATGVLLDRAVLAPGDRYQVISRSSTPTATALRTATPASGQAAAADLALPPGAPTVIASTARQATAGASFPFQQADMLASYLLANERYDPTAPPGHTYGAIAYFLATSHRGTSEQFATAFALMARTLGLPTRIVVGFRTGTPAGPDTWQVDAGDVLVWPEVDFHGIGWTAFYPTPASGAIGQAAAVPAGETAGQQQIDHRISARAVTPVSRPLTGHHQGRPPQATAGTKPWSALLAVIPATLAAFASWLLLVVPWLRRRRRQRAPTPGSQVIGAWQEAVDRLRACGTGLTVAHSAPEIAEFAAARLGPDGAPDLWALAALADRAGFGMSAVSEESAHEAWQRLRQVERAVRRATTRRARLAARLHGIRLRGAQT